MTCRATMKDELLRGRRVVIVGEMPECADRIRSYLKRHRWRCDSADILNVADAAQQLREIDHELIICILPQNAEEAIAMLQKMRATSAQTLIAVGAAQNPDLILRTLHEGEADQYVDVNNLEGQLGIILERLQPSNGGKIIAVLGPGGGVGASTLAANLSVMFGEPSAPCMLLDMNLQFGAQANLLDLKPASTLADFCRNRSRMDVEMFEQLVVRHKSGVDLLAGPPNLKDAECVTRDGWMDALELSSQLYPYCVVDADPCMVTTQVDVFQRAGAVLLVFQPTIQGLGNVRQTMAFFKQSDVALRRVWLVLNEVGLPHQLRLSQIRESLQANAIEVLPYDPRRINHANNIGIPTILRTPRSMFSKKVKALSEKIRRMLSSDQEAPDMAILAK